MKLLKKTKTNATLVSYTQFLGQKRKNRHIGGLSVANEALEENHYNTA
jgi:hypothetical protein